MSEEKQPEVEEPKAKETAEPPQVEEPTEKKVEIDTDAILAELENIGVQNAGDLQNVYTASRQAGNLANKLGEKNQEVEQLRSEIEQLKRSMYNEPRYDQPEYVNTTGTLTKDDIKNAFRDFYKNDVLGPQQQAYQQNLAEYNSIRNDPRYKMAGRVFEQHIKNPNVQMALNSGQTSLKDEYNRTVIAILENLSGQNAKSKMQQVTTPAAEPEQSVPHMETSESAHVPKPDTESEKKEKVKTLTKPENWDGTTDSLRKLVDTMIPPDDPLWRR